MKIKEFSTVGRDDLGAPNTEITVKAYAKVNLSLDILRKRPDGYHDLRMVTQTVSLCDTLTLEPTDCPGVSVECNFDYIPSDERNLAVAAALLFQDETRLIKSGLKIKMDKKIPVCAGLGGGSADAAAVLRGLNTMLNAGLSTEKLCNLAARLGSDVPFCVVGGTLLMEGRGEILTPVPALPDCHIVICKPSARSSTLAVFGGVNAKKIKYRPDNDGLIKALEAGSLDDVGCRMFNVLEDTVARDVKEIKSIRRALIDGGAIGACMTGTGTAVTGLFNDRTAAEKTARRLSGMYENTFITEPVGILPI